MHIDTKTVFNMYTFAKKHIFTKKVIAISIAAACCIFAYSVTTSRIVPMAYGSGSDPAPGADLNDVVATALSILMALVSFVASHYLGVKPEIIQAVVAFEKDKSNQDNLRRLGAAITGYTIGVLEDHPEGSTGFVLTLLTTISSKVSPEVANILNTAARDVAAEQFKVSTNVVTPVIVSK